MQMVQNKPIKKMEEALQVVINYKYQIAKLYHRQAFTNKLSNSC